MAEVAGVAELAELIHVECCGDRHPGTATPCPRWADKEGHRDYYHRRAEAIWRQLEPLIGGSNVLPAVAVVLKEIW